MSNIAHSLRDLVVPVAALTPYSDSGKGVNPRKGNIEAVKESLARFGQVKPIVAQEDGTVVAGNHTLLAAKELGWEHIAVVYARLTNAEAKAYMVADNRTTDLASNDDAALVSILEELSEAGQLDGTGYSPDDIDDILSALDRIEETELQEFEGDYAESPEVTAARWEGRDEGQRREVVFLLPKDDFEMFRDSVTKLKTRYGTDSMATAVFTAVMHEANSAQTTVDEVIAGS
jgi:hypothetical protein